MEDYKKGGKIKRMRKIKKMKKVKKVVVVKKPKINIRKQKIMTQEAKPFFGYANPPMPSAPAKPIDEIAYAKVSELLRKTEEENKKLQEQQKKVQDIQGQLMPFGGAGVQPDYEEIQNRIGFLEEIAKNEFSRRKQKPYQELPEKKEEYIKIEDVSKSKRGRPKGSKNKKAKKASEPQSEA
jgi:hypothetical protein